MLTLLSVSASRLDARLRAVLLVLVELHHLGHDEALLEVRVDPAGSLGSLGAFLYGPGLHLVRSSSEEILELEGLVSLDHDLVQTGGALGLLTVSFPLIVRLEVHQFLLEGAGEGDDGGARVVLVDVLLNLWQPLVLLSHEVFLTQVHQVDHRLGSDKQVLVQDLNICLVPVSIPKKQVGCELMKEQSRDQT